MFVAEYSFYFNGLNALCMQKYGVWVESSIFPGHKNMSFLVEALLAIEVCYLFFYM